MPTGKIQAFSLGLHVLLALLLLITARTIQKPIETRRPIHVETLTFIRPPKTIEARTRGGGSNRSPLPAVHGSAPPKAARTFIPPASSDHPALPIPITISFDVPTESASANIGDPLSKLAVGAFGSHGDNGIGNRGCCGGLGESQSGAPEFGVVRGTRVTPPELLVKVEPEFSEEARKAKHQGVVVLAIVVDSSGNVRDIRVRQSLGLGLDEKAIDAVAHWRFRPGVLNGKPVSTEAVIQVNFQLL